MSGARTTVRSGNGLAEFDHIHFGVATARRAWIEKKDVPNTLPLKQLLKRLAR